MFNITSGCGVGFIHNYVVKCSISQVNVGLVSFTIMLLNVSCLVLARVCLVAPLGTMLLSRVKSHSVFVCGG